jgi:hypothetical protein
MSMKNPLTPAGIETATFRFVTQHANHCAIAVPTILKIRKYYTIPDCAVGVVMEKQTVFCKVM